MALVPQLQRDFGRLFTIDVVAICGEKNLPSGIRIVGVGRNSPPLFMTRPGVEQVMGLVGQSFVVARITVDRLEKCQRRVFAGYSPGRVRVERRFWRL